MYLIILKYKLKKFWTKQTETKMQKKQNKKLVLKSQKQKCYSYG